MKKFDIPPQDAVCIQKDCGKGFNSGDEGGFNLRDSPAQGFRMGWTCGSCYRSLCFTKGKNVHPKHPKKRRK